MADDGTTSPNQVDPAALADFNTIVDQIVAGFAKHYTQDAAKDVVASGILSSQSGFLELLLRYGIQYAAKAGAIIHDGESLVLPILAGFTAPMVAGMFGAEIDESAFASRAASGQRSAASRALVDAFLAALTGDAAGEQEPSDEGAKRVAAAALNATLEGWFMAAIPELVSDLMPADWLHFEAFTKLPQDVIRALGIGRLVRRALTPLVNATATTPMTWLTNKAYRPKLLSEATAIKQFLRGAWDWPDVEEELSRQGYNSTRIEALYNDLRKFQAIDDLAQLVWLGLVPFDDAVQTMRAQGFDDEQATRHFNVRKIEREESVTHEAVTAAVTAFAERRIEVSDLDAVLDTTITSPNEHQLIVETAQLRRTLTTKFLSSTDAKAAVKAEILAVVDYRAALEREGYDPDAVDVLELLLRKEIDGTRTAAQVKADAAQAKSAAAAAKRQAADQKKADIDAARQLKQQGTIAEIEHAAIIGLVPIARLAQILTPQFDADTVSIYVADVEQKRQAYLDQQQAKADAAKRADNKGLPTAMLEQAVYDGIISMAAFTNAMTVKGISGADAQILTATVAAKKADLDAAKKKRADADFRAAQKKISLSKAEQLVRLGIWTEAQYQSLLASLGYADADVAALTELLETTNGGAQAGTAARAAILKADPASGLTLEQFRTAVKLGDKSLDQFQTFLVNANYTADQQAVLVDELRSDLAVADAARLRRQQGDTGVAPVPLKLATATKAAQLGIITPAAYQQRLVAGGYSADDVAIELQLLTAALSKSAAAKQAQGAAPAPTTTNGATLDQLAAQVGIGQASVEDFRAAAVAAGLDQATADGLVAQLNDTIAVLADAKTRRDAIAAQFAASGTALADLEGAVLSGSLTVIAFESQMGSFGVTAADAQLVGALLEAQLSAQV